MVASIKPHRDEIGLSDGLLLIDGTWVAGRSGETWSHPLGPVTAARRWPPSLRGLNARRSPADFLPSHGEALVPDGSWPGDKACK